MSNASNANRVSANFDALGNKSYDFGEKTAILGEQLGIPCKCAIRLRQSTNDLKMIMLGSDEQIVNYYKNYDSAISTAESEMVAAYGVGESIDSTVQAAKNARAEEKADKKREKLEKKKAKAAERQAKAEAAAPKEDSSLSGSVKDYFGL